MNQTATWDIAYAETATTRKVVILHLAEREENYERALCGKVRRNAPLEPNAQGELCIVCADLYWKKHGVNYGEAL